MNRQVNEASIEEQVSQLRAEVQILRDKDEIREVMDTYAFLLDSARWRDIPEAVFTHDGIDFHLPENDPPLTPRGHEELRAFFDTVMAEFIGSQHMMGNYRIEIAGDEAYSRTYALATHWNEDTGVPTPSDCSVSITYDDKWRRTDVGWRVYERRLHAFGPFGLTIGSMPPEQGRIGADLYGSRDR